MPALKETLNLIPQNSVVQEVKGFTPIKEEIVNYELTPSFYNLLAQLSHQELINIDDFVTQFNLIKNEDVKTFLRYFILSSLLQFNVEAKNLLDSFKKTEAVDPKDKKIQLMRQIAIIVKQTQSTKNFKLIQEDYTEDAESSHNNRKTELTRKFEKTLLNMNVVFHLFNEQENIYWMDLSVDTPNFSLGKKVKGKQELLPIDTHDKIVTGGRGNHTYIVIRLTDKKLYFVRGDNSLRPNTVLSSKFATLISPLHFSSEHRFKEGTTFSTKLNSFAASLADRSITKKEIENLRMGYDLIRGAGIIDETLDFIGETDFNDENFGASNPSLDFKSTIKCKIDFDGCNPIEPIRNQILGRYEISKYFIDYLRERITTRLKLSLLSDELISHLVDQHLVHEQRNSESFVSNEKDKLNYIQRRELMLKSLVETLNKKDNPLFIEVADIEYLDLQLKNYVIQHVGDNNQRERLLHSLSERKEKLLLKLNPYLVDEKYKSSQLSPLNAKDVIAYTSKLKSISETSTANFWSSESADTMKAMDNAEVSDLNKLNAQN